MSLTNYLKGQAPLWQVFWIYNVLVSVALLFAAGFTTFLIEDYVAANHMPVLKITIGTIATLYSIFASVITWKSAFNCTHRIWTWLVLALLTFATVYDDYDNFFRLDNIILTTAFIICLLTWIITTRANKESRLYTIALPILFVIVMCTDSIIKIKEHYGNFQHFAYLEDGNYKEIYINPPKVSRVNESNLRQKAIDGDYEAAYSLAQFYSDDEDNAKPDYAEALRWYQVAADHGDPYAKNNLAILYEKGLGTEKNIPKAIKLYKEAAEVGHDTSIYNLGLYYETKANSPDYAQAAALYKKVIDRMADTKKFNCAPNDLGALYALGKGVEKNETEARYLFQQAASKKMIIKLPAKSAYREMNKEKDFADVYATYRLAEVQKTPLDKTDLSADEIAMAKIVADYYQKRCRE